jgi:hypothetical protein
MNGGLILELIVTRTELPKFVFPWLLEGFLVLRLLAFRAKLVSALELCGASYFRLCALQRPEALVEKSYKPVVGSTIFTDGFGYHGPVIWWT